MSAKNCDKYNRWRSITIGFRVSPEEAYALDMRVLTSGLTKQDYCTKKVLDEEVIIRPNGVEFEGQLYRSLTAVAKKITGTHWNGKIFFGVK